MRRLLLSAFALTLVAAATAQEDPVMKARAERAAAQGISERDLPPVPRGIVEPPALPPAETNPKDLPGYRHRRARGRKGKRGRGAKGGAHHAPRHRSKRH
jgi:hypothetical protein